MRKANLVSTDLSREEYDKAIEETKVLYICTTSAEDKELPIYVAESMSELARMCGVKLSTINSNIARYKRGELKFCRYQKVDY